MEKILGAILIGGFALLFFCSWLSGMDKRENNTISQLSL